MYPTYSSFPQFRRCNIHIIDNGHRHIFPYFLTLSLDRFDDTKEEITIRKLKKDRQHRDLHNITHKTKDRVTRTPL